MKVQKMTGWIKLYRKVLDDGWLSEHKLWAFWTYCLLKATHKDTTIFFNGRQVTLLKGQLIIGRKKAAQELKLGEQEIRTCIKKLKKYGNITIKPTTHYSIITIVNWDTYQSSEDEANQQSNQDLTNGQPASNHIQEGKKERTTRDSSHKEKDPRVKEIIDYFFNRVKETKGFPPEITGGKDGTIVKNLLAKYPEDRLKNIIDFFLDSEKAEKVGITLSAALTDHTINLYKQAWQKRKHEWGDSNEPPTNKFWWG